MVARTVEIAVGVASAAMFVVTLAAVPILIVRMPADHFVRPPVERHFAIRAMRNVTGMLLVAFGVAMLVLPGQGLLTILLGLSVLDLPIKHRFLARILRQPKIGDTIQAIRAKAGKEPLLIPDAPDPRDASNVARARPRSSSDAAVTPRKSREPSNSAGPSHA